MVVFMVMTIQFKSLRLPLVMLFAIPVCLIGIVLALMAAGQGFSVTALMGILMVIGIAVSNGILLVAEASVRLNEGASKEDAIVGRGADAVHAHHHDKPGDRDRAGPHRARSRGGDGGKPGARACRRRRAHVLDGALALPCPVNVHLARKARRAT